MIKTYIKRPTYLAKVLPFIDKDIIKVIVGQRRVGKSYLLYQIMDKIKANNRTNQIIYLNKELNEFDNIKTGQDLWQYVKTNSLPKKRHYLFIDEIQEIKGFERILRGLLAQGNYDIYCTGSNSKILSSELASGLSGRVIEIPVHSLSYSEFLIFHNLPNNEDFLFKYIKYGGLPYLINLELTDDIVYDYLKNVYSTIILKDVVSRYNLRNVNFLNRLVTYTADNVGSLLSAKKISDFLKSQKMKMSPNIVINYLSYLQSVYFLQEAKRQDLSGKKIFEINEKYYFQDLGLRHCLIGYRQVDIGKIIENLVYNQLNFLGYKVFVGQMAGKEIDFICEKPNKRLYIQVAYLIGDGKIREREFGNLLSIEDNYPKFVVSMDKMAGGEYKGVQHLYLLDFLRRESL